MPSPNQFEEILLVEDNPGDVRLIEEMVKEASVDPTIHAVTDGSDALDFLHRSGEYADAPRPDAIFLDLHLSRMDGEEVLEEMPEDLRDVPVVVISGSQLGADLKLDDVEDEVHACLEKPLEPEDLEALARSVSK